MNLFVLKYCLLVGAILTSTALVGGPLNPQKLFSSQSSSVPDGTDISADSVYQFGSDIFYKEVNKPGNEYMKQSVEGYNQALVPNQQIQQQYSDRWALGVADFESGYVGANQALVDLGAIRALSNATQENAVCQEFHTATANLENAENYFTSAKASSTASSADGFTISMVIERVDPIRQDSEDAEEACFQAALASRNGNVTAFSDGITTAKADVKDMNRIYPELKVLSNDFT